MKPGDGRGPAGSSLSQGGSGPAGSSLSQGESGPPGGSKPGDGRGAAGSSLPQGGSGPAGSSRSRGGGVGRGYRIALIGGDGIGPEVVREALKVVAAAGVPIEVVPYDLGADRFLQTGEVLPDSVLEELRSLDAILLGAVGPPIGSTLVPPGTLERGLLLRLRFELDLYINLRPFTGLPGSIAPGADFVVIRENTEGSYAGEGGFLHRGTAQEIATQGSVNTRFGVERCLRYAFELALKRPRHDLTLVHKTNVLAFAGDLWQRVFTELSAGFQGVATSYNHVDAACIYLVEDSFRYDVVVTENLFGDILTDLAGAVTGGIGFAASANLNPARTGPSLFEPVHGAAHDIAGTGKANPLAAIRSAALMLDHLGELEAAQRIDKAVREELEHFAPGRTTGEIGDALAAQV